MYLMLSLFGHASFDVKYYLLLTYYMPLLGLHGAQL
jgi:hypothetical protein